MSFHFTTYFENVQWILNMLRKMQAIILGVSREHNRTWHMIFLSGRKCVSFQGKGNFGYVG